MVMKQKNVMLNDKEKNCDIDIDEEVVKEIFKEVSKDFLDKTTKRRLIVRQPSGEIAYEMPVLVGVAAFTAGTIFLFPAVVIALIYGYRAKLQLEVIRDISEEEAEILATLERQDTIHGVQYEMGDGQATVIQ